MQNRNDFIFTSESVGEGHPDKICDIISDSILDKALEIDLESRVACECLASTGLILVGGEITTGGYIDIVQTARNVLKEIGYDNPEDGIDNLSCSVLSAVKPQSSDISEGVTPGQGLNKNQGAGDQGMMFGYACKQTDELMPAPILYAHNIMQRAARMRKSGELDFLRPDGKCQVTVRYEKGLPIHIDTIVISHQYSAAVSPEKVKEALIESIVKLALPKQLISSNTKYYVNPTGRFVIGGPKADVGLTGRKIIVDTYGGYSLHGGGAFSGKDPSKVDRSAAYMCRYIAKNIVAAGITDEICIQLAYAIGISEPVSIYVDTVDSSKVPASEIEKVIPKIFELTPAGIIKKLNLKRPIYKPTAAYGHFGRSIFPWEQTDMLEEINKHLG